MYKVSLNSKVLSRARKIFSILLGLFLVFVLAGIHQGVQSGDFDKVFVAPFRQFSQDLKKATEPSPTPSFTPLPSPSSTPTPPPAGGPTQKPNPKPVIQPKPVTNCIQRNIREGEFASNKCYSQQDYEDLNYYLNQYSSATGSVSFYETKVRITCGNNDFHKTCEQDKKDQQANLDNISRYRSIIQGIIARGK